jgi:hypothetical protein
MWRVRGRGMGRMCDKGVGVGVRGLVHAHVPVGLTGCVSVGHGSMCGRREEWDDGSALAEVTRRGKGSCQMQEDGDIYMKNAAGEGRSGPSHPSRTIKDDQAGGDRSEISLSCVECLI